MMRFYNTLTRSVEPFEPLDAKGSSVNIYACGPTVYDRPHIGHGRSAYIFDMLRRFLEHRGYGVRFVRNVTDVDDKIIEKARGELGGSSKEQTPDALREQCLEVAKRYLNDYHLALGQLGIAPPTIEPLATEHVVPQMTDLIAKLLMQGAAYEEGGHVYFSVRNFSDYGRLSNRTPDELLAGFRVEPGEHKRDPLDFALWKRAKPGEPSWKSPWGEGRPGWHIECSAMSIRYLGETFDIHGGGLDLVFPHHENEHAQARAAGYSFARYWMHHGLLTVNGEKMSKSLGNIVTVDQALESCEGQVDALKMFFLSTHYRHPVDYTPENMRTARGRLTGLLTFLHQVDTKRETAKIPSQVPAELATLEQAFEEAMDEDLNTPKALAVLDRMVNCAYQWEKEGPQGDEAQWQGRRVLAADKVRHLGGVLGLFSSYKTLGLSAAQRARLQEREQARKEKNFPLADTIRKEFAAAGLIIEDTSLGPVVRPNPDIA